MFSHLAIIFADFRFNALSFQRGGFSSQVLLGQLFAALIFVAARINALSKPHQLLVDPFCPLLPEPDYFFWSGSFVIQNTGFYGQLFAVKFAGCPPGWLS